MKKTARGVGLYVIIFLIIIAAIWTYTGSPKEKVEQVPFSEFVTEAANSNFKSIHFANTVLTGVTKSGKNLQTYAPSIIESSYVFEQYIAPKIEAGEKLEFTGPAPQKNSWLIQILPSVFMILIFVGIWFFFMNQSQGGGGKIASFGKSRAKLHKEEDQKQVVFKDVAGLDEEKEELEEVVDFLKTPAKYIELGARIPKGILLVGPPGTGKTYLSKAAAGEAGVPFYTISGSDFVEMFVGVGASRVRDLFAEAKKNAPCIIFIDEIDAVGRKRGAGLGGGHDEREQTLNQLLVEMDGFGINEGIIILAATNRPDVLDPALLRPGRFDRQVIIGVPDLKGREAIIEVHVKNKPLADDVKVDVLARRTPGFTPADIENLLNEAAILTARRNKKTITMEAIEESITKVIAGPEKKSRIISEEERRLTAYHEAGHALVARLMPKSDPVHQVTIIPRGRTGGFTMTLPKEDKNYITKKEMNERIVHLLGGRVAEKLVLDDISSGASNDIERATDIARSMITKYGMSDKLGPVNYSAAEEIFLGKDFSTKRNYSEEIASEIDQEIREVIEEAYTKALELLQDNLDKLHRVANALLDIETIDAEQFECLFKGEPLPERPVAKPAEETTEEDLQDAQEAEDAENAEDAEDAQSSEDTREEDKE